MTGRQVRGYSALVFGSGLLAVSLMADFIGIGNDLGIGAKQTMGTIAGVITAFLGLTVLRKTT